jgi:hypothetical protein
MSQEQKKKLINPIPVSTPGMTAMPPSGMTAPSPNIVQRIMGGVMSDRTAARNPEMEKAWAGRSLEFPEAAAKVTRLGEMGKLKQMITGGAYGSTSPFGTIELNMDAIKRDNQDINDVLAHEMAHAGQGIMGHIRSMFGDNKPEEKAINAEVFRKVRKGDIHLAAPRDTTKEKILATRR